MVSKFDAYTLLRYFANKHKSARISYSSFLDFVKRYTESKKNQNPSLRSQADKFLEELPDKLEELAKSGKCILDQNGPRIHMIHFPQYYYDLLLQEYKRIDDNFGYAFPTEDELGISIPDEMLTVINAKSEFIDELKKDQHKGQEIAKVIFPEGIREMLVPKSFIHKKLIHLCIDKIRLYINTKKNYDYVRHKMYPAFASREAVLKEMLDNINVKPTSVAKSIMDPDDFSFRFWAQISGLIVQELFEKSEKPPEEHSICQAAMLLGFYNLYFKNIVQNKKHIENSVHDISVQLQKPPYAFTNNDISSMKNKKGDKLLTEEVREPFYNFLEKKTYSPDKTSLPEIIQIKTSEDKQYYVYKKNIPLLVVKHLMAVSDRVRKLFVKRWVDIMKEGERTEAMKNDELFSIEVDAELQKQDPLLYALLKFDLLFLVKSEIEMKKEVRDEIDRIMDVKNRNMKKADEILGINKDRILNQVKLYLPFWETIPVLRSIVRFLINFFTGKSQKKKSKKKTARKIAGKEYDSEKSGRRSSASSKAQRAEYKKAVKKVRDQLLPEGETLDSALQTLAERWNPLVDAEAKKNLIQDVNALIRDYLRGMKKGFRIKPPDKQRIQNLAKQLGENSKFDSVRDRKALIRYIELYMIHHLLER